MRNIHFIFMLTILACGGSVSPGERNSKLSYPYVIDLEEGLRNPTDIVLSEIADSITYVQLDKEMTVPLSRCWVEFITDSDIFIVNPRTESNLYRYSLDGRMLNSIGIRGRGPGEYSRGTDFTVNATARIVICRDVFSDNFLLFRYSGEFLGKLPLNEQKHNYLDKTISLYENTLLDISSFFGMRSQIPENYKLFTIYDHNDQTLFSKPYPKLEEIKMGEEDEILFLGSRLWWTRNAFDFSLVGNTSDTVFIAHIDTAFVGYILNKGPYTIDDNEVRDEDLFDYLQGSSGVLELGNMAYFSQLLKDEGYTFAYNKVTNECSSMKLSYTTDNKRTESYRRGFVNDIDGGPDFGILGYYPNNKMAYVMEASEFLTYLESEEFKTKAYKDPQSRERLIRLGKEMEVDDNPVVVIAHLKEN